MPKNIVICTDGTWNTPDQMDRGRVVPSNVVKVARAVSDRDRDDTKNQIYYYDKGVGTGGIGDKILGGITGAGLVLNTKQAYSFICKHFEVGDNLFLFGFSRGAYTARYLAGMIGKVGIRKDLVDCNLEDRIKRVEEAFKLSKRLPSDPAEVSQKLKDEVEAFRSRICHLEDRIHFLGVWDTVGSMGIPIKPLQAITRLRFKFGDVRLGDHVANAFHALANFSPTLWVQGSEQNPDQVLQQVWFAGVHTNIGGGYVDTGLSDCALLWMALKAEECGLGIDGEFMLRCVSPDFHGELRQSNKGIWKLLGARGRKILENNGANQSIHVSAASRAQHATDSYEPLNLLDALRNTPSSIAAPLSGEMSSHYFADPDRRKARMAIGYGPEPWR
jgi:uncharacterized protein (DUF2235 family)